MAFWKKWTQEIWFQPRETDVDDVVDPQDNTKKKKKKKKKIDEEQPPHLSNGQSPRKPTCKDYLLLDKRVRIFYVVLLCFTVGVILPSVISYYLGEYQVYLGNCNTPTLYRFECLSGSSQPLTLDACQRAGCCWDAGSGVPKCYHKNPTAYTYHVSNVAEDAPHKMVVDLTPERLSYDMFGSKMPNARAVIRAVNRHHLIVQLLAANQSEDNSYRLMTEDEHTPFDQTDFKISVATEKRNSFAIVVKRASTDEVLLDTSYGPLVVNHQYVEMSTTVPSLNIYGLGQDVRRASFNRSFQYEKMALYNRPGADGYHPFFMAVAPDSHLFHGVYWDNDYPLEVQLSPTPAVSYRAMGGIGVLHILLGPTPADVSHQFVRDIVGNTGAMPPFWSLGFHMCRENDDSSVFDKTAQAMLDNGVGFDSDCIDLRLSGPGTGIADLDRFPRALDQREWLRDLGKKFVLAQPPHVTNRSELPDTKWILVNSTSSDAALGRRSGSDVYYPSYPSTDLLNWDAMIQPEGFHLVDNWPSNEKKSNCSASASRTFTPERIQSYVTSSNTVCLDAYHPNREAEHLAVHNLYGVDQLKFFIDQYAYEFRFLYLNRASALANLGRAGYAGEDYSANWVSMELALVQVMEMGLYGVPLAGAPICGALNTSNVDSQQKTDEEQLCLRWYQLGTLLPYAHSTTKLGHRPRSPVDWSVNSRRIIAGYIQRRYRLLSHFYTLFYQASTVGTPVVRPMWYEFPQDNETYLLSKQFMIGRSIMVAPAMVQDNNRASISVKVYFPAGTWYDYYTGEWLSNSTGVSRVVMTSLYHINMFVLNATVYVTQEPGSSAEDTRKNPYTVTTAFPITSEAEGWLYVDDGVSPDQSKNDLIHFTFTNDTFTMTRKNHEFLGSEGISTVVDHVRVFGFDPGNKQVSEQAEYNPVTRILEFKNLNFDWTTSDEPFSIRFTM